MGKHAVSIDFKIYERILELLNIQLFEQNILSTNKICISCHGKVEMVHNFRQQIISTDNYLKRLLAFDVIGEGIELANNESENSNNEVKLLDVDDEEDMVKNDSNIKQESDEGGVELEHPDLDNCVEEQNLVNEDSESAGTSDILIVKNEDIKPKFSRKRKKPLESQKHEFVCTICGKCLKSPSGYESHLHGHAGYRPFCCKICNKQFTRGGTLAAHMLTHSDDKAVVCEICSKQFISVTYLNQHKKTHLPDEARLMKCSDPKCNKVFRNKRYLDIHILKHTGVKTIKCKDCNRKFYTKRDLYRHTRTFHLKIKNHVCNACGKAFSNSGNLVSHIRIHTGEKNYECKYCSSRYNQSTPLKRHMKKHEERGDPIIKPGISENKKLLQ